METPRFLDIIENGWASENNPHRTGYFFGKFTSVKRMNPGLTWKITNGKGEFWHLQPDEKSKLRVIGNLLECPGCNTRHGTYCDECTEAWQK